MVVQISLTIYIFIDTHIIRRIHDAECNISTSGTADKNGKNPGSVTLPLGTTAD